MDRVVQTRYVTGNMAGTRIANIVESKAQAIAFPRQHIGELKSRAEFHRQAVYFLLGDDPVSGCEAVYVGEAKLVTKQFIERLLKNDFWWECLVCPNPGTTFSQAQIKYLHSILVAAAKAEGDYRVVNAPAATEPALGQAGRDAMDEYAGNVRALVAACARSVFEPGRERSKLAAGASPSTLDVSIPSDAERFQLRVRGIAASGVRVVGGALRVLKRSGVRKQVEPSLSNRNVTLRSMLIRSGVLVDAGDQFKFVRDHTFTSPTQAASVIVGYNVNGKATWKLGDGRSLGEIDRRR